MIRRKTKRKKLNKYLAILAVSITLFLFSTILFVGSILDNERQDNIEKRINDIYRDMVSLQTLSLIDENEKDLQCIAFKAKMRDFDSYIWELGDTIENYRIASEEFFKNPFYKKQKEIFNENEVVYYLMMKRLIKLCSIQKEIMLFFYRNSEICKKCDDQSFVLTDINEYDDKKGNQIAIFSFDLDLNISTVNILSEYYGIGKDLPCIVFSDKEVRCGMLDKREILIKLCILNPNLNVCDKLRKD